MPQLPDNLDRHVTEITETVRDVEGFLTDREMRFLALLGACPTAEGRILEIGSFKGKSSIILSKSAGLAGDPRISSVDPLTSPSVTDPDLKGKKAAGHNTLPTLRRPALFKSTN